MLECSGYDNNMAVNAMAALQRGLDSLLTRGGDGKPDRQSHKLDASRLPEFQPEHRIRVTVEFIPAPPKKAAPVAEVEEPSFASFAAPEIVTTPSEDGVKWTKTALRVMNKERLMAIAELVGIDGGSEMTNAELQSAIIAAQG